MGTTTILRPAATRTAAAGAELVDYAARLLLERLEIRTITAYQLAEPARRAPVHGGWLVVDPARKTSDLVADDVELVTIVSRSRGAVLAILHLPAAAGDAA